MINVLMCTFKSGDVIGLTLKQLIEVPEITRILIADGPHLGPIKPGEKIEHPTVKEVVDELNCPKIFYDYTDDFETRADKNNHSLRNVTPDCKWILNVDSDEVYHEKHLSKLVKFLKKGPKYGRYKIKTINPYPDFHHEFRIPDWKPRLYAWEPGCKCPPNHDRLHQYVLGPNQIYIKKSVYGMAELDPDICQIYHLNALRMKEGNPSRITKLEDGTVRYKGGGETCYSEIYPLSTKTMPKSIRDLKKDKLID